MVNKIRTRCPHCQAYKLTRSGWRWVRGAKRQRLQCQGCGKYTTLPKSSLKETK